MSADRPFNVIDSITKEIEYARKYLYDKPLYLDKDGHYLRLHYDGTVYNGINGVQVVFDQDGELLGLKSFHVGASIETVSFTKTQGGWMGEGGFSGDNTVIGTRLNAIVESTKKDWEHWKSTESEHPGVSFREWKKGYVEAMADEYHAHFAQQEPYRLADLDRSLLELISRRPSWP